MGISACGANPSLTVESQAGFSGLHQEAAIIAEAGRGQTLKITGARDQPWAAVLERGGRRYETTAAACSALAQSLERFADLPALKPGPLELQRPPFPMPIPTMTKDGDTWSITTLGFAPDWSSARLNIRGDQGPYANWASDAAQIVQICAEDQLSRSPQR